MSRPNQPGIEDFLSQKKGSRTRQSFSMPRVFCRDIMFLCRDRVGNGGEALCPDIIFYVTTECGQKKRFCVATEQFYVTI